MAGEKYLCWTDLDNKRFYAPVSSCMVSIPGRKLSSGYIGGFKYRFFGRASATVYIIGGTIIDVNMQTGVQINAECTDDNLDLDYDVQQQSDAYENYAVSDTSPGSIFTVPTFYEALQWVKTGKKDKALYGTES